MEIKLISFTKPAAELNVVDGVSSVQDLVAYCARVSNPANQNNKETNEKLIKYLIKHQHWSPLEMVNVCLEINTTRDIGRQILRHRSFVFQEFSQRYADIKELEDMFTVRECRMQDTKNRQDSLPCDKPFIEDEWEQRQREVIAVANDAYRWAIENGIAKEVARCVLPEGNTKTRMYMNGSLRSWVHYILLRRENGTQKEHMQIALACADVIQQVFPMMEEL